MGRFGKLFSSFLKKSSENNETILNEDGKTV